MSLHMDSFEGESLPDALRVAAASVENPNYREDPMDVVEVTVHKVGNHDNNGHYWEVCVYYFD